MLFQPTMSDSKLTNLLDLQKSQLGVFTYKNSNYWIFIWIKAIINLHQLLYIIKLTMKLNMHTYEWVTLSILIDCYLTSSV